MKLCSAPLPFLAVFLFFLSYHHPAGITITCENSFDQQKIRQVVIEAVEYNGWINQPDYREKLGEIYTGTLLTNLINSVEQFRGLNTDWHSLTFTPNCHIVYNNSNTAEVLAFLLETNPEGDVTGLGYAVFQLHNTPGGWRITQLKVIWPTFE